MHVYNDHVEIWNEGELPDGYNEEVLYGKHSSKPRNRNIADTMFKAGFIDTWGRGYKKIQDGFKAAGLPKPTVKSELGGTMVTFKRGFDVLKGRKYVTSDVTCNVGSNVGSLSVVQLSERQRKICELIKDNAYIPANKCRKFCRSLIHTQPRSLGRASRRGKLWYDYSKLL